MQRLVYSPKVNAYVKTDTGVVDISSYITSGNVHRKVGQVSTAEITIRNPQMRFTQPGAPTFHPMDTITIFMTRLKGAPVQVFTGFLDQTPYLQLYPGTCTITASCTLKRLLYTFWDPALQYVAQFLTKHGWQVNYDTGQLISQKKDSTLNTQTQQLTDGSIGSLLFAILNDVGHWDPNNIYIEKLPEGIVGRVSAIYQELAQENKKVQSDLKSFLEKIIGTGSQGGAGPGGASTVGLNGPYDTAYHLSDSIGWPHHLRSTIARIIHTESGGDAHVHNSSTAAMGLFQIEPYTARDIGRDPAKLHDGIYNAQTAFILWKKQGFRPWFSFEGGAPTSPYPDFKLINMPKRAHQTGKGAISSATSGAASIGSGSGGAIGAITAGAQKASKITPQQVDGILRKHNPAGKPLNIHGGIKKATAIVLSQFPALSITSTNEGGHASNSLHYHNEAIDISGDSSVMHRAAAWIMSSGLYKGLAEGIHNPNLSIKNGKKIVYPSGTWAEHVNHIHLGVYGDNFNFDGTLSNTQEAGNPAGGGEGQSSASAFAATLNFPSAMQMAEATMLQGQKSLMNDVPLFPFIDELAGASLRSFMSLPNGDFYAFFPDYFGGFGRQPYWIIDDIEVLDGGINLSDDALATHVYVVGDTLYGGLAGGDAMTETFEGVQSGGVMTVFDAFKADFLNLPGDTQQNKIAKANADLKKATDMPAGYEGDQSIKSIIQQDKAQTELQNALNQDQALEFLQKYGARPHYEYDPLIRSPYFEAFYAYMRFLQLWSMQFLSTFTFTFMPEIYPGGLVYFEAHDIQCYVEEVVHSFDYEAGFSTQAQLSSPSAVHNSKVTEGMVRSFQLGDYVAPKTTKGTKNSKGKVKKKK